MIRFPKGYALVELFRYRPTLDWGTSESERRGEARYVAYLVRGAGKLAWRDLGVAQSLEQALWEFRAALSIRRAAMCGCWPWRLRSV